MLKRLEIFNALSAAVAQHPDVGVDRLIINRNRDIAEEALPTVHMLWPADRVVSQAVDKAKRELTVIAEIYAKGKGKEIQSETLENAICEAVLGIKKQPLGIQEIKGADADNDEENASFYEFCQVRLTFTISYIAPQPRCNN